MNPPQEINQYGDKMFEPGASSDTTYNRLSY